MTQQKKYLAVVAHPDDEVLGFGATTFTVTNGGAKAAVATMCTQAAARANLSDTLCNDQSKAFEILGITEHYGANFPNIKMNTVAHLDLVQFIEDALQKAQPDVVITHHPTDTNIDHVMTQGACQAAVRLFQRRDDVKPIEELWYMEILSATDWSLDTSAQRFQPNTFVEVGEAGVKASIEAMNAYTGTLRPYPHPRSVEGIKALATTRGVQAGLNFAQAFECAFRRISQ